MAPKTLAFVVSCWVLVISASSAKDSGPTILDGSAGVFPDPVYDVSDVRTHQPDRDTEETHAALNTGHVSEQQSLVEEATTQQPTERGEETTTEAIVSLEEPIQDLKNDITKRLLPVMVELAYDPELSHECVSSFVKLGKALGNYDLWALRMVDSIGKPPSGIIEGALGTLGSYDECLNVVAPSNTGEEDFRGQYCSLFTKLPKNPLFDKLIPKMLVDNPLLLKFVKNASLVSSLQDDPFVLGMRLGVCIPSKCSDKEFLHLVTTFTKKYGMTSKVIGCKVKRPIELNNTQMGVLCVAIGLSFLVGLASSVDIYLRIRAATSEKKPPLPSLPVRGLLAFSAVANTEKIFNTYVEPGSNIDKLRCIHGVRVISALWVMLAHVYTLAEPTTYGRAIGILEMLSDRSFAVVSNGFLSVDTFFLLSGFLVTYSILTMKLKPGLLSFVVTLYRRYIRLTLPGMYVVGIILIYPLLVRGPVVDQLYSAAIEPCYSRWWDVLALRTNFRSVGEQCGLHLWYIAADFQIYAVCLVFIFLLRSERPAIGIAGILVLTFASCLGVGLQVYIHNIPAYNHVDATSVMKTMTSSMNVYFRPFCHIAPFAMGVLSAYLFLKHPSVKINRMVELAAWAVAIATGLTVVYAVQEWGAGLEYTKIEGALYAGLHRMAWGISVGWAIYACSTGRGGFINTVLSHWIFVPFSRLTFSVYLVHMFVVCSKAATVRSTMEWTHWFLAKDYIGLVVLSFVFAYLFAIFCEAPVVNIDKFLFDTLPNRKSRRPEAQCEPKITVVPFAEQTAPSDKTQPLEAVFIPPVNCSKM